MNSIFAALINGAILSVPLTVAIWLCLRLVPRSGLNAATRHVIWWSVLAVTITLPLVHLPIQKFRTAELSSLPSMDQHSVAPPGQRLPPPPSNGVAAVSPEAALPGRTPQRSRLLSFPVHVVAGSWPRWILAAWMLMTALMLVRLIVSIVLLERKKARAAPLPAHLAARAAGWLAGCGSTRKNVRLVSSTEIVAPIATGPYRPATLIPARLLDELKEDELDQVGLHEAAHFARRDDYALMLQRIVEALFAMHPVVHWITRQINLEREIACDDFVVEATRSPYGYAACLTRVAELSGPGSASIVAAAVAEQRSHLTTRVEMLLDKTRHTGTGLLKRYLTTTAIALAAFAGLAANVPASVAFAMPYTEAPPRAVSQPIPEQPLSQEESPAPVRATKRTLPANIERTTSLPLLSALLPQTPAPANPSAAPVVLIPVKVTDPQSRFVTGLAKNHFKLLEDGVEQQISQFSSEGALSIGIVFDISSTAEKLSHARQAISRFFETANRDDEFLLVQFNDRPQLASGPTANTAEIENKLTSGSSRGRTALLDMMYLAVRETKKARNPCKALLVISDGEDNGSRYTSDEIQNLIREAGIRVYVLGLSGTSMLYQIAEQTGGRHFTASNLGDLPQLAFRIGVELRNLYVLGYQPKNTARDGQYRSVEVRLIQPNGLPPLGAESRAGYYATQ